VEDGHTVAIERHLERFRTSALAQSGISARTLEGFFAQVLGHIPRTGSWFPRIELVATPGGPALRYRERVAPAWSGEVSLGVARHDPRTTPHTKGPDLEALLALRSALGNPATTEALILSPEGYLVEGAYSSIMVWPQRSSSIVVAPSSPPRIPSVTEAVLTEIASESGVEVSERSFTLADLEGAEVWVLSALHGIRVAHEFFNGPQLGVIPGRRDQWQAQWWARKRPF
jgi:branched-subunit amino acid aminotransferase/4-amino-4-deoxychorismate lyase